MREAITYPCTFEDGTAGTRLWPKGPRWNSAEFVDRKHAHGVELHIWRVTCPSIHPGEENAYYLTCTWPDVWHKETPALVTMSLDGQGARLDLATLVDDTWRDLLSAKEGGLPGVADPDIVVDLRDDFDTTTEN